MATKQGKQRLKGKVAIVTGAGRGIGRAEAMLLAAEGARVVVNDLGTDMLGTGTDQSIAGQVAAESRAAGGEAVANTDSVTTMEGGERIIKTAIDAFGKLDILINNAGAVRPKIIFHMTEDDWDSMISVHLKGHFTTIRFASPIFREQKSGVIVNTASESGLGHFGQASYSAAKEGIVGLTRTAARDLRRHGMRRAGVGSTNRAARGRGRAAGSGVTREGGGGGCARRSRLWQYCGIRLPNRDAARRWRRNHHDAEVAKRQTQRTQNPPCASTCGFKSRARHQKHRSATIRTRHLRDPRFSA